MKNYLKYIVVCAAALLVSCVSRDYSKFDLRDSSKFSTSIDGEAVSLYTIATDKVAAQITNYGARLVSLMVADRMGEYRDVVWGYDSIEEYLNATDKYSGPIVGRFGNRINNGRFSIDGVEYQTTINNGKNHLHGGVGGFSTRVWSGKQLNDSTVVMSYVSPAGEEGYPGELNISVKYVVSDNLLTLSYEATTDAPTIVNPTSHCYFNLNGDSSSILSHQLQINADRFTPTDETLIPTGEISPVAGTPMDFRAATKIGERINRNYEPLKYGKGYDHNWVFTKQGQGIAQARLYSPASGIEMTVYTDQPAIQFYSGNFMDGVDVGKRGDKHNFRSGVALETQNYPDAPNHANFPNSILREGEVYRQTTTYAFDVK